MAIVKKHTPDRGAMQTVTKRKAEHEELTLPTEKSKPRVSLADYSILLYGGKKIGKTTLAAQFPNAFIMAFEPGTKALEVYDREIPSWMAAKKYVKLLKKDKKFSNVIVDTIDVAYTLCFNWKCQEMGIEHPSDEGYGKGWSEVRREFVTWVQSLLTLGKGVIFISHSTEREIKRRDGSKYDQIQPTMAGQARDIVEAMVDIWGYYAYERGRRILVVRGDDEISAGHRLRKQFRTPDGKELRAIDMGASEEEGYKNLLLAFANKYVSPAKTKNTDAPPVKKLKQR